ncbi:MAG: hypothetical protein P8Y60_18650 [Calditrichota bacterium]
MAYLFTGKLFAYLCPNCPEDLSNVTIRLYRLPADSPAAALATANPKDTFVIHDPEEVNKRSEYLLAEGKTNDQGEFEISLGKKQDYDGGPFEVDVYLEQVPGGESKKKHEPAQFTITTLQPQWRQKEEDFIAYWKYGIPQRFWCGIRLRFDAWVICGIVTTCETQVPLAGLTVKAFDADWLQDDPLGSATTDSTGKFRIDYTTSDFRKTPFSPLINLELIGGPDLFFHVESGGSPLLEESRSRGRDADRENVGPCFCVGLCVPVEAQPPVDDPWFTHVGDFHILSDIDSTTGKTNKAVLGHGGPDYGFFGNLKFFGYCYEDIVNNPGTEVPITGGLVAGVKVGSRLIQWDLDGTGPQWTFQSIYVAGSGATPDPTPIPAVPPGTPWGPVPAHIIVPDGNGWVTVDQNALDGGFMTLLGLRSTKLQPVAGAPGDGAGNPVSDPKNGLVVKIIYEAEPVAGGPPNFRDELPKLLINNWIEVRQLNLLQFQTGGSSCTPLTSDLDIKYTVDHELIAAWTLTINSAAFSPPDNLPVPYSNPIRSGNVPRGDVDTVHLDISDSTKWPSCSYKVWLTTRRALTDGEDDDDADSSLVTFCK